MAQHTEELKAKARAMYEAGKSMRVIADKLSISSRSVFSWAEKDGWEKGANAAKLLQKERQAIEKQIERQATLRTINAAQIIDDLIEIKERCLQRLTPKVEKDPDGNWIETGEFEFNSRDAISAIKLLGTNLKMWTDGAVPTVPVAITIKTPDGNVIAQLETRLEGSNPSSESG